jgi:hypothetical protein
MGLPGPEFLSREGLASTSAPFAHLVTRDVNGSDQIGYFYYYILYHIFMTDSD